MEETFPNFSVAEKSNRSRVASESDKISSPKEAIECNKNKYIFTSIVPNCSSTQENFGKVVLNLKNAKNEVAAKSQIQSKLPEMTEDLYAQEKQRAYQRIQEALSTIPAPRQESEGPEITA